MQKHGKRPHENYILKLYVRKNKTHPRDVDGIKSSGAIYCGEI